MTDTSLEIQKKFDELIMARSGEERFIMGAQMFDAAVTMILASFPPELSEAERKRRLFERLYGFPAPWCELEASMGRGMGAKK